jgi:hypothetical protein
MPKTTTRIHPAILWLVALLIVALGAVLVDQFLVPYLQRNELRFGTYVSEKKNPLHQCASDADCVPDPAMCHPSRCINKIAAREEPKLLACTMIFDHSAAYSPEDCACRFGVCINKNNQDE